MSFYLAIVSPLDTPLFEIHFASSKASVPLSASSSTSSFPSWSTFTGSNGSDLNPNEGNRPVNSNLGLSANPGGAAGERHLMQMIAHSSLDVVEEIAEGAGSLYLKSIDRHNEWAVSAFLATNVKLILLHDNKNDDGIRLFFGDVWELFVKVSLNPFHSVNTPIRNPLFESKIRASAKKYL